MIKIILIVFSIVIFKAEAQSSALNVADSLMAVGNFSKVISLLENYENEEKYYKLAKAYNAIGNYDKASFNQKKAVENNPNNTIIKYELGKLLSKTKANDDALLVFNELIEKDKNNATYYYEKGVVLDRKAKVIDAQNNYKIAFKLDNENQKAIYKLAKYSLKKKQFERLDTLLTVGLNSYAKNAALTSLKAQSMYAQRKYKKAIIWFEKLLELEEKSEFIYEKLSFAYQKEWEHEKAVEHLKSALLYNPKNAGNIYRLGVLYELLYDYQNAEKNIKLALQLQDEPLDIEYSKLGTIYNQLKKPQEAVRYFNKALKENPNNEQATFFLVITKSSYYKDLQSKIDLFEAFIKNNPKSRYIDFAKLELSRLKTEAFMKTDDAKD